MKLKIVALALFAALFVACTQRTCPTYTKEDVKKVEKPSRSV